MGQLAKSVLINRSQQDVFDFLSNPANLSKWSSAFESAEWTSSATPGTGSTYRVSAKLFGSTKEGLFEIVHWDRPNRYSYRMTTGAFPIERMESTVTLSPKNDGTQVTFESQFELVGALKFVERFFARMGEKQDGNNFDIAKRLLEAVWQTQIPKHQTEKGAMIMSVFTGVSLDNRSSLLRSIALGGVFIFVSQLVVQSWFVYSILQQNPFISVLQYMASGAIGMSAFEGGSGTALLGVLFHLVVSFVIAAVFVLSANRIPLLRRNIIAGALLYGLGVWVVMHLVVLPLSAAPPVPPPTVPYLIEEIIEHMLVVGLPLGLLVRRSANPQSISGVTLRG